MQVALSKAGAASFGIDASKQMGRLARANIRKNETIPLLVNGYAQFLPLLGRSFNQVVATFPTEYIYDPATIQEVYRVLVPGGRLVILLAAWITGRGLVERTAAWLFRVTKQAPPETPGSTTQSELREALAGQLVDRLERTGFHAKVEFVEVRSSILMIVVGDKV
jgi:ubiquinone/menaquinone biosynthesis C-methylase UbiE